MKKILLVILIIVLCLFFTAKINGCPRIVISNLAKKGELHDGDLKYKIYFFGVLPVGQAVLKEKQLTEYKGETVFRLNAQAESLKIFSGIFSASADINSYVDRQTLNPVFFKQNLRIKGKDDIDKEVFYNQKESFMTIKGVKRQILPDTQDPLSTMLNFRNIDFSETKTFEMNLNTNQKNYLLSGEAEQKTLSLNKKIYTINSLNAEIKRRDKNNPYHKSKLKILFLEEGGNIPIIMKVFTTGVFITIKLAGID